MSSNFTAEFFAGNRRRLRELCGSELVVLTANGLLQRGGDSAFPFRQDANFWYLTGLNESDLVLVMDEADEFLIVPARDGVRVAFEGEVNMEALTKRSGIEQVMGERIGWKRLRERLKRTQQIGALAAPPAYVKAIGLYTNPARARLLEQLKEANHQLKFQDISQYLVQMRVLKQPEELAAIRQAIDITIGTLKETMSSKTYTYDGYRYEYELEAEITRGFRRRGASGHAFDPIVAGGKNACVLHYASNNDELASDRLTVLDAGAEVEHYAADITRTVAFQKPGRRQTDIHAAVLAVQEYAFTLLKPGVLLGGYEKQVEHFMGEKLRELGLIKAATTKNIRRYYPHVTSHFLGLNAHDVGDRHRPLEAGMVLTVEPGIYIAEESLGVRIEDDILVTKTGVEVLSRQLAKGLQS